MIVVFQKRKFLETFSEMIVLFFFIFLSLKYFSFGCFPNPTSCSRPLIPIGDMFECPPCPASPCSLSGPMVDVIPDATVMTAECCCIYTATATCNPVPANKLTQILQFSGSAQSIQYPLTLTCDTTTNRYTFNNGGVQTQITSAQCCRLSCGTINRLSSQVDNIFAPDASCTYRRILTCVDGSTTMQINAPPGAMTGAGWPGPETFPSGAVEATCPAGAPTYVHNSPMFGPNTPIGKAQCP